MVNTDFESFRKHQKAHKPEYVGSTKKSPAVDDARANGPEDTDLAPGATGREK
ncbi:hypothetical protein [Bacillus thermotolerans]|uniref:Uncharacterized protein n=1 Tax=Bacillus thermotolerans TaxID=1221996 RepID=A0A0F5I0U8_BACTR|nr:hypothetical protein [Bacillus thermotolerans]KKB39131.1 hypothetical protein QY97_00033 [Bacillus thermotolerans]KKB41582.1 hypothetical protein QY96_01945 [Bacillus thermotolerans]KKB42751.1 hypothetical protein QY95_03772 [Bacillus thermotolerans]